MRSRNESWGDRREFQTICCGPWGHPGACMAQRAISELIDLYFPNVPVALGKQLNHRVIYSSTVPLTPLFTIPSVFWWVERRKVMCWDCRTVENRTHFFFTPPKVQQREAGLNLILNLFLELLDWCSLNLFLQLQLWLCGFPGSAFSSNWRKSQLSSAHNDNRGCPNLQILALLNLKNSTSERYFPPVFVSWCFAFWGQVFLYADKAYSCFSDSLLFLESSSNYTN